jgi:hypothetical protein
MYNIMTDETCDNNITDFTDLIHDNSRPDKIPPGGIVNINDLQQGKSYKIYKVVDFQLGKVVKCGEITLDTKKTGFIKPPYYLVPTLKNRVASIFGIGGGGKKSRKHRKNHRHTRRRKYTRKSRQ